MPAHPLNGTGVGTSILHNNLLEETNPDLTQQQQQTNDSTQQQVASSSNSSQCSSPSNLLNNNNLDQSNKNKRDKTSIIR